MKLEFSKGNEDIWFIDECGEDTDKVKFEHLGFIFKDELGIHWKIEDNYSGIIELSELQQITDFMEQLDSVISEESE